MSEDPTKLPIGAIHQDTRAERLFSKLGDNLRGILSMVAAMSCFIISDICSKLASSAVPSGEVIAVRGLFASLFMGTAVLVQGHAPLIRTLFSRLWAIRMGGEIGAAITFIPALAHLPISNVVTITQTTPLALTAAGALLFGEPVGWRRWTATAFGFGGVLLIVKPGTDAFSWWSVAVLGCVIAVVIRDIATRRMSRAVPATLLTATTAMGVTLAGCVLGLFERPWSVPDGRTALLLAASGVAVSGGYYFSVLAVRFAALSTVAPFRYTIVPLSLIAGYVIWGDKPDAMAIAGIVIIVVSGLYLFLREHQKLT
jgi:drug/metabolite transporter (DMT)-like permease